MAEISELDRIDFGLLSELQKNARLSNKELASKVGLAPSSCLERVRRLKARGALTGFHAAVDPAVLGIGLQALVSVRIRQHSREWIDTFHDHVVSLPETSNVYHLAGANDFLVHVLVRDSNHLRDLALDAFTSRPEVEHMETALIFSHESKAELPNYTKSRG